ncbi:hypothetical protein CC1G_05478 [Coprinopsis cinerea okayama7|uniref:Uncharacterized protein n=1 Tax=Coprinopsis cinerea (strain Okayama-7 / 130 / ATCC MYA-4618 / FGSC 9003) TaxID=240176 RepID=A8P5E7_COPC7|nr:hypothetical protein CC1G_05478 [Coprinopsis cinerea okayama7\|eukprot:XP_001838925.2 hypothetical protein CC1G_05478 [Coprinopsis cinerea okayama7\
MPPSIEDDFELVDAADAATSPAALVPGPKASPQIESAFDELILEFQKTVTQHVAQKKPIFHTQLTTPESNTPLFQIFLDNLPEAERPSHTCNACRRFINSYGGLCLVNEADGSLIPLLWPDDLSRVPQIYQNAVGTIYHLFKGKVVDSDCRILSDKHKKLGIQKKEGDKWWHFYVTLDGVPIEKDDSGPLDFKAAYEMLSRILADNSPENVNQAHSLIHEKLPYSTSHKPAIDWLQKLITELQGLNLLAGDTDNVARRNLIHFYARDAWAGCLSSLRGGAIGELLGWISEGLEYKVIEKKWKDLANPHNYLRPKAVPSLGNIAVAEKTLKKVGLTKEDLRRFHLATDELPAKAILWKNQALWDPAQLEDTKDEIFGDLKRKIQGKSDAKSKPSSGISDDAPPTSITFRHFVRRVLPTITSLEIHLHAHERAAFLTRGAPGSQSPFVFDSVDPDNTMSWYYWGNSHPVSDAGLTVGWNQVAAISTFPHMWDYLTPQEALDWDKETEPADKKWIHSRNDEDHRGI